jgi:hypothetical protein
VSLTARLYHERARHCDPNPLSLPFLRTEADAPARRYPLLYEEKKT